MEKNVRLTISLRTYNTKYLPKKRMFYGSKKTNANPNPNPNPHPTKNHNTRPGLGLVFLLPPL